LTHVELLNNESSSTTWKEKMIQYFSATKCKSAPPEFQDLTWLKQIFVLIGVQKGGTKALHTFLEENPQFVSRCDEKVATKELFFFNNITGMNGEIDQLELQKKYADLIQTKCPLAVADLVSNSSKMYLDDTPLYIQDSNEIPQLMNCVTPKSKIMAILRNPTDRAFSHFNFYLDRNWCMERTFDEWVDLNIYQLTESGVVQAKDPYEELLAWERYNKNPQYRGTRKCLTFVTRGLYAIQLLHFMTALKAVNRSEADLHVISSESLIGDQKQQEYDKVLQFLGLAPHTLHHIGAVHKTVYERTMNETTRVKLNSFFRPYNLRLYEMLNWDPIWEKNSF
jgi:Sulfotransferase domain